MRIVWCAAAVTLVIAGAPDASAGPRRASSETGPLIMSGTMVPPAQSRRARAKADICVPVTVKRRPLSLLSLR
ncbi:MAG: hypothetical protein K2Z80_26315 [Xanthobacteraceae bacterium]|nr:hypothetical protein [Xanthobacteraceae bacterium]